MQIGSKPDGRLPKAPKGGGRVKQSQGLVAWGWLWNRWGLGNVTVTFLRCSPVFPLLQRVAGLSPGIPPHYSRDKYLLTNYCVLGRWW